MACRVDQTVSLVGPPGPGRGMAAIDGDVAVDQEGVLVDGLVGIARVRVRAGPSEGRGPAVLGQVGRTRSAAGRPGRGSRTAVKGSDEGQPKGGQRAARGSVPLPAGGRVGHQVPADVPEVPALPIPGAGLAGGVLAPVRTLKSGYQLMMQNT